MTHRPSAADFALPATFVDDVMRRVDVTPRPMPVRSFWSAVVDRSALDVAGSVAVAWRLLLAGGRVPVMVRAQALALVVLVAVSIGGTGTLAAAAAYRTVAPIVFRDDARELLSGSAASDEPDVVPRASPLIVAPPDRPDRRAVARPVTRSASADATGGSGTTDPAPGRDRDARAEDEDGGGGDGSHEGGGPDAHDGSGATDDGPDASPDEADGSDADGGASGHESPDDASSGTGGD